MSSNKKGYFQGFYTPLNPKKYKGTMPIIYRSSLEYHFSRFCDVNKKIIEWGSESNIIPYVKPVDGKVHRYYVDYYIVFEYNGKREKFLIEIKPYKQTILPTRGKKRNKTILHEQLAYAINQSKWESAERYAKSRGWTFKVITENDLGLGKI